MKNFRKLVLGVVLVLIWSPLKSDSLSINDLLAPQIQVSIGGSPITSGDSHDFGNVNLLSASAPLTITIENIGTPEDLNISQVSVTGTHASDYTLNTSGLLAAVPPSGSTSFTITFAPSASGARIAAIEIQSDDGGGTFIINLTGNGVKLNQTITFGAITSRTYGNSSFTLSATASSGLAVSYISNNPLVATVSGNTVTIVGAGSAEITASQAGDGVYNAATAVPQTLVVNKATLTATANNQSRVYQTANPTFTIAYAGFVNGDDELDIDTPPTATTTAILSSPVTTYPITPAGGVDNNYSFTYVNGTLTITKATPVIIWNDPAAITYGTLLSATQLNASTAVAGTFTYTPAVGTLLNAGVNQNLSVDFVPTDAVNYNSVLGTVAQITVNKASLTATGENKSRVYGAVNPTLTVTYTGFVNSETSTVIDNQPAAGTIATVLSDVGAYPITLTGGTDNNYTITLVAGSLSVTKAPLTVTANNQSRVYQTANPTFTIAYAGFVNGDDELDIDTPPTATTTAILSSPVTTYPITPTGGIDNNYSFTYVNGTLTITKATPVITWNDPAAITYGTLLSATQLNASTGVAGTFTYTPASGALLNAGVNQNLSVNFVPTDAVNYNSVLGTQVQITVNKAPLTATAENKSRVFGASNPALTIAYTGFVNSETSTVIDNQPTAGTVATTLSDVGTYPITLSGGTDNNYTITPVAGTLSITKAALTATAENKSRVYGAANPTLTIQYTGFVNGNTSADLDTQPTINTAANAASVPAIYPITLSGGLDNNYNLTLVNGSLTITKALLTVTANNQSRHYGEVNPTLTLNYAGFVNSETPANLTTAPTAATVAGLTTNVGTYTITIGGGVSGNYDFTYVAGTLTITKATVVATANNQTRTYGAVNPTLTITYTGFANGETVSVLDVQPTTSTTAIATSPVGGYPIQVTGGTDGNYEIAPVSGTLTITKATLTATAVNTNRPYGSVNPTFTISYTGFQNGENALVLDTAPEATSAATLTSDVGTYPITVSGGLDNNYNLTYVNGTLTITKVTITATAANASRVFGVVNPTFIINYTGFVNGENSSVLDVLPVAGTAATTGSNVGTYPIIVSGGTDANYNFTYVSGTLTIIKATPTVTWNNPSAIIYGTALGATQLNATASVAGSFVYTPASGTVLNVGVNQVLSVNFNPTDATNYNSVLGTTVLITVNKATLTATANNQIRTYGATNPTLTIAYTGFVNGDNASVINEQPTAATVAVNTSAVGSYAITLTGGTDNNYDLILVNGTLTINKATLVATAQNANRIYGAANPAFVISYTGFVNSENSTVLDTPPTASTAATVTSAVGAYSIVVAGGLDNNYTFTYTSGTLTITKATVTATVANATRIYGVANPTFTITYSGFVNSETSAVLDVLPTASTTAIISSNVGVYPINAVGGNDNNYTFNYVSGTLTITKATPAITWNNPTAITFGTALGAAQLNATASVPGNFVYSPTAGTVLNAGANQTLTVNFTPSDGINYESVTGTTVQITVNRATPVLTWPAPNAITYGTALSATQLNASPNVAGTFVYSPASGVVLNAGVNQTLSVNFTPTDALNYNSVNGFTTQITVNKATPSVTWSNPAAITYGTPLSATQLNATATVPGSFVYAPGLGTVLNAGTNQSLSVNFTPTDAINYNTVNGTSVLITVNKATPTVTWNNPANITYGTALSATQLNATASVAGSFVYTPAAGTVLNAGTNQSLSVNFTPTDINNYNPVNGTTVLITVGRATPVITWNNPAAITYGTALSATQLNASTTVTGTFVYTPTIGTLLNAGPNQVLSVNFTPTDMANYNPVSNVQRLITVNKATPVITWANPAPIIYGTPLSSTQLNASASVPGTLIYTPASGTVLNTGANQTLTVNFTPTDAINYNSVTGTTVLITVNKATPVVNWSTPLPIKINEPLTSAQLNATANVPGTFSYTPAAGASFATVGTYTLTVSFTPTDATNYNSVPNTQVQIQVNNKDNPVVTWNNPAAITYGTTLGTTQLNATANVPGTFVYAPAAGTLLNAGTNQTLSVNFIPTDAINFNSVTANVTITVNKATLAVIATSTSRIYGAANPAFALTYAGFVNGENDAVIDTPPTTSSSAIAGSNAGSAFPIIPAGGQDNNYAFNYINGSLSITKAPLIARADNKTRLYGVANPVLTIGYTGFVNGDTEADITPPGISTSATITSNVGNYPIQLSGGISTNYNFTLQNGTLTVNSAPLTARADDKSKTYGQVNPALTITYTGFLNGDNAASITQPSISTAANTASAVGTYPITLSGGASLNYAIVLQAGTLTINKTNLTVTANNQARTYGSLNPALTFVYTGFVNSETSAVIDVPPTASTSATVASSVGTYAITLSGGSDNNYNLNIVAGSLTINKATLSASVANATRTYGAINPTFIINYSGFLNGDDVSDLDTAPGASTAATVTSSVGTYPITASGGVDNNYNFSYTAGTLTVGKTVLTATAANTSRPYGTANPVFVINYAGFVNGENSSVIDVLPTATTTAIAASPIGNYPINVAGGSDGNYSFTYVSGVLEVGKTAAIVTWNNPTAIVFGTTLSATQLNATANVPGTFVYTPALGTILNAGINQILTVDFTPTDQTNYSSVNGTTVTITVNKATPIVTWNNPAAITYGTPLSATQLNATANVPGSFTYSPSTGAILNAGNQTLSVNFIPTNTANYNSVNNTTVQITVNKATPVVTWSTPAAITFGTTLSAAQLNASATTAGSFVYSPASGTILNAGANQTLSVSFTPTDASNFNSVPVTTVQLTVNKATPVVTWNAPAAIVYGTALGATQLNASANTTGTFTYTPASGTILNAGANQVLSVNFAPSNTNNFNPVTGVTVLITVNKATPVVTWANPATISYGTALGATQLNATASVAGTFTYSPIAGTILDAGTQTLSVDFVPTNTANYNAVSGTQASLTINKVPIVVTANNRTRSYGAANPTLTITYAGFVNGENETVLDTKPVATTATNTTSNVGSYPITVAGGVDNNYNFSYVAGALSVTKATLTATANNQSRLFGTPNPEFTITYTGFVNTENATVIDTAPVATTTATQASAVGGYPITVSGGVDNNYSFTYQQGTLTVTPNFPPTITNFEIETLEDQPLTFTYNTFGDNFESFSGSAIVYVKVISLPLNGSLTWNGAAVTAGAEIVVNGSQLQNFVYTPASNFNGNDSFKWNAFEGTFLATLDATVAIKVNKVNDAPVLTNIENTSILYSLGDPAVQITSAIVINDVDDNFLFSARVNISENFTRGDVLSVETGISQLITVSYNSETGVLDLSGKDTRANYQTALTKVSFRSPVSGDAEISDKRIVFTVKDSVDVSNAMSRIVTITEIFPEVSIVNSFTPNDDGVNDVWNFLNLDFYSQVELAIFDRNGTRVFECKTNDCTWDGKMNGKELPPGPYFYTLYLNGGKRKYQGIVTILR
jgi:gliding motility-associated-like protein